MSKSIDSLIDQNVSNVNLPVPGRLSINDEEVSIEEKDFQVDKLLGSGQFSVKKLVHKPSGKEVAVKEFPIPKKKLFGKTKIKEKELQKILNEIDMFNQISLADRDHIVQFFGWAFDQECIRIYMEPMQISLRGLGDLHYFNNNDSEILPLLDKIIVSVIEGLLVCREQNISHGDLKPDNILMNLNGDVKLTDFGESRRLLGTAHFQTAASPAYWPPEKYNYKRNTNSTLDGDEKHNVWILGIMIMEIFLGIHPNIMINRYTSTENFALIQKTMLRPSYANETIPLFPRNFVFHDEFLGECLKPYEIRPDYKMLKELPSYSDIKERSIMKNLNFSAKEFIEHLQETRSYTSLKLTTCHRLKNDLSNLKKCQENSFIVAVFGVCLVEGIFYICEEAMDICLFGLCELLDRIPRENIEDNEKRLLSEEIVGHISVVILNVLEFLNNMGYIHGNICQRYVLFRRNGVIKISGLENMHKLCMEHTIDWSADCQTCALNFDGPISPLLNETHVPPERFLEEHPLDFRNDIWGFAAMLTYGANCHAFNKFIDHPFDDKRKIRYCGRFIQIYNKQELADSFPSVTNAEIK